MPSVPLILASQSPRRKELLREAGYSFKVILPEDHAESPPRPGESPHDSVLRIATEKAENVAQRVDHGLIIAGDTLAELDGNPLGKPRDRDHAREILHSLRGREHFVWTAIALWLRPQDQTIRGIDQTIVRMSDLADQEIESYLDTGLWKGKAGAFGIQDRTGWVNVVRGSESNVVGLPLELLSELLIQVTHD
ncbi:MAG: nucleoside triphosphate pyrophosphatase [Pirellulaceae bacterium]